MITTSSNPPLECDYNFHKSNSTYFTDSDVGRLHLVVALCGQGVEKVKEELRAEAVAAVASAPPGTEAVAKAAVGLSFGAALGGVAASFRREIKPFEGFEVWTRILAWDNKWLYMVQHFVKKGAVKKGKLLLQPEGKRRGIGAWFRKRGSTRANGIQKEKKNQTSTSNTTSNGHAVSSNPSSTPPHPAIFATLIAKYVFKHGRRTIPPERVLQASNLLPPKPPSTTTSPNTGDKPETTTATTTDPTTLRTPDESVTVTDDDNSSNEWTWEKVEQERIRGLRLAEHFANLDTLNGEFPGDGADVLGVF